MRRRRSFLAVPVLWALCGCLPSYAFSDQPADAGGDSRAEAGLDARVDVGPDGGLDAGLDAPVEAGAEAGIDAAPEATTDATPSGGVTLDPGFPVLATISNATPTTLSTPSFDVPGGGRMLVAVVVWGWYGGNGVWPVTFMGAGLTWTSAVQTVSAGTSYPNAVGVGIWTAWASTALTAQTLTATRSNSVAADAVLAVYSLAGAKPTIGATGGNQGFTVSEAPLAITLDAEAQGSFVVGGLLDGNGSTGLRGNTLPDTVYDQTLASGSGNGIGVGRLKGVTTGPGTVTIGQDSSFEFDVTAGVEILAR